ncbi:hypothetical protein PIB30_107507, partial [Stylosanthes scabra]|nr:hypothetical protein [Stylosanthes scabra]
GLFEFQGPRTFALDELPRTYGIQPPFDDGSSGEHQWNLHCSQLNQRVCKCVLFVIKTDSKVVCAILRGIKLGSYWVWTEHGETDETSVNRNEPTTNRDQGQSRVFATIRNHAEDVNREDNYERYNEMIHDVVGVDNM